jgi:hypothetical protein
MRSYRHFGSLILSLVVGGTLAGGCYSSTKEVDTVPAPVVQVPAPVVQLPPAVVQVPAPVAVAPEASQTTTSTSWGNGAVEQQRTTKSVNGQSENQTTTTWNNGEPSQTTTTTTTKP